LIVRKGAAVSEKPLRVSSDLPLDEMEIALLRAVCSLPGGSAAFERVTAELAEYRWKLPDHQVIYAALVKIASPDLDRLRRQLPAATVRMGFPDIDWQRYLPPEPISTDGLDDLIRELKSRARIAPFGNSGPIA
jgi:hypothetical protein